MRHRVSALLALLHIALAVGCVQTSFDPYATRKPSTVRLTAAPTHVVVSPVASPGRPRDVSPASTLSAGDGLEAIPQPAPTLKLAPLIVSEALLLSWTNPNDINDLLRDGQYLWAATSGGVVRWELDSGESRVYTHSDGLVSLAIRGLAQDGEGHIWVGYADHPAWSEYDGEKWSSYASREEAVTSRYKAMLNAKRLDPRLWGKREGGERVWLPTFDGKIKAYDGHNWYAYGPQEGVTPNARLVCVSAGGRVWAVGESISTAKEGERQWKSYSFPGEAPEASETTDLAVDGQERAWLAFASHHPQSVGVACLDPETSRWIVYTQALNPAIPRQIYNLDIAQEGTLWLYGDEGIAFAHPGTPWEHLSWGIPVQALARDEKRSLWWIGSSHGIWLVAPSSGELQGPWLVPTSIPSNEITSLAMDSRGTLWIGTPRGLSYATASGVTGIALNEEVFCLASDARDELWAGTSKGLYQVRNDGSCQKMLVHPVTRLAFDAQGTLWICTLDGQLGPLDSAEWRPKARLLDSAMPLHDMIIRADGSVWLGTANGLATLSPEGDFAWANPEERFLKEDTRALALGPDETLWIGTTSGLARRLPAGELVRLTPTSTGGGLRATEIRDLHMTPDGTLWIATSAGISLRTPKADWFYFDLPGVQVLYPESPEAIWIGTKGGLYRLRRELFIAVP